MNFNYPNKPNSPTIDDTYTVSGKVFKWDGGRWVAVYRATDSHSLLSDRDLADQHTISSITGLQSALDGKANSVHSHQISDVLGLASSLDDKANTLHGHNINDVSGLESALSQKQNVLVSGTSIKTINGESLLGSGDIQIEQSSGGFEIFAFGYNVAPFVSFLKISNERILELTPPSLTSTVRAVEFTPDGKFVFIGLNNAPFLQVFEIESDQTFTPITITIPSQINAAVYALSYEPRAYGGDGTLVVGMDTGNTLVGLRFDYNTKSFSNAATITSTLSTVRVNDVKISPDGLALAVAYNTTSTVFFTRTALSANIWTQQNIVSLSPLTAVNGVCWVDNSNAILSSAATANEQLLHIVRDGTTFTQQPVSGASESIKTKPANNCRKVSPTIGGSAFYVGLSGTPFLHRYNRLANNRFVRDPIAATYDSNTGTVVVPSLSQNVTQLVVSGSGKFVGTGAPSTGSGRGVNLLSNNNGMLGVVRNYPDVVCTSLNFWPRIDECIS